MTTIQNYINGKFVNPKADKWLDNYNPSVGEVYGKIPSSNVTDVEDAVLAAKAAFPKWSTTTFEQRSEMLLKIANGITNQLVEFAQAESKDNGKLLSLALSVDIPRAISNFKFYANAITQYSSKAHESVGKQTLNFTLRKPLGVVGCISPWNLPLYLFTWKIAPALAAGNCVVAKPSEITPMTAYLLSKVCKEAGLPDGVLNIIHGLGKDVGQAITEHTQVKAISFTGGTKTGQQIAQTAAPLFKKLSLEMGGKNPNLIFADCDYGKMLQTTVKSSFANQGQICLCGSRIFVEKSIYAKFKKDFVEKVKNLKVGDPKDANMDLGAIVSKEHLEKIEGFVKDAPKQNAKILCGGNRAKVAGHENGYYFEPTIIEVNSNQCTLNQEEIFGPVVTIMPFSNETNVLEMANDVRYGLSATVWTSNIDRAMRLSNNLETGIVWVNTWLNRDLRTPFGGVKDSGVGREGGFDALDFFTEAKNVCIEYEV
ncbi:aldehyde dehydrogenase [Haloflavibacter putidus]|uniref:Aldehyde dehydrogenase n=1 Tax=Haloflavibacter putidus TaxID=2576776 RepID=A0A507ZVQ5_9FLAO|nr:aldehyde dehydrogenase [Haloflavibacter putidus]TQD38855.1 aldehyde dehydrogenase [Haloflavibacter putidus]